MSGEREVRRDWSVWYTGCMDRKEGMSEGAGLSGIQDAWTEGKGGCSLYSVAVLGAIQSHDLIKPEGLLKEQNELRRSGGRLPGLLAGIACV